ncbi:MAG: HK97 family phage prohead protease [Bacteroidaceae bacterium]|jgi:HK97 family phage prohead protease|nr:HK97 family phage prohead protease [Bacteroidaceae bacterium]
MSKEQRNDFYMRRGFTANLRADGKDEEGKGHIVEGLAAVCEQETVIEDMFGSFTEVIRKGAFDKTDFDDVRLLVNHDFDGIALARSRRNNKSDKPNTMQLTADEDGVHIKADLDTENNEQARAVYSAISRGDMDGMSFCFYVSENNQEWSEDDKGNIRREITAVDKVIEVSVVNFPAYAGTSIDSRSLENDRRALENARKALENARSKKETNYNLEALLTRYGKDK